MSTIQPSPISPSIAPVVRLTGFILLALNLFLSAPVHAEKTGFEIRYADTNLEQGMLFLEAQIDYQFSDVAAEALQNGVTLFVILDVDIIRPRRWRWDKKIAAFEHHFKVQRHALSGQYFFTNLTTGDRRRFESMEEMLARLGAVTDLRLLDEEQLEAGVAYNGRIRARLDIESLPSPLRPLAYLSRGWRLSSPWYHWQIKP